MSCRKCTTRKIFAYIQQRVSANKAARQVFCSSLLFCFRELNRFLEISVRAPWKILRASRNSILKTWFSNLENWNSKLEPRNLILDSRKLRGSRIEFRVETVNFHLNGTVDRKLNPWLNLNQISWHGYYQMANRKDHSLSAIFLIYSIFSNRDQMSVFSCKAYIVW